MREAIKDKEQSNEARSNQPLETKDKLYFTMAWWGVQSWSRVNAYKANGYDRKYRDARRSMFAGVTIYGVATLLVILVLFQDW